MSLFERIREKRINLKEQSFTDRQKSDMKKLLNKNFGSKEKAKATAGEVIKDTAKKDVERYFAKSKSKSKGGGATTGGTKTVNQSEVSKQAKKFTKKINKKNINRPEGVIGDTYVSTTKKGKIRSAKKVNPTLKKSISQVKGDIEFKQSLKKAGASGDVSDTAPKKIRDYVTKKRETRATKLGTPDPFKIDTSKASKEVAKDLGPSYQDIKKGKIPKNYKLGGKSQFDISKTPVGKIKLPPKKISPEVQKKTFDAFKTKISVATKQTKQVSKKIGSIKSPKMPSQPETGFGGKPGSQPVGGTSGSSTKTVKQSEVSKKAKDFTQKINQKKTTNTAQKMSTVKGDPLQGNVDYDTSTKSTPKPKKPNVFKRVTAATSGKKVTNSKGTGNQFRGPENKAAKDARIKLDRSASGMGGGKPPKPPTTKGGTLGFPEPGDTPKPKRVFSKQTKALMSGQGKFAKSAVGKGIRKNLPQVYKGLKTLGPAGRAFAKTGVIGGAATIGTAFLAKNLLKKAAIGGVGGGILGGLAASQKQSDKERIKKNLPAKLEKDKSGKDIKTVTRMNLNLSDYSKKTKKLKPRTATSLKGSADYAGKVKNIPAYGAKYTG